jgi:hypothetical protein
MDLGVERLHPPVHHLGKAGQVGDVAHLEPRLAKRLGGAAGRDQLDARRGQRPAELDEAGLVRHRQQGALDLHPSLTSSPFQAARRTFSPKVQAPGGAVARALAGDDELERLGCAAASPSIHKLSSIVSRPPRQRNCQTVEPRTLSSAPWPSAVVATSTAGARWKRRANGTSSPRGGGRRRSARPGPSARARRRRGELALVDEAEAPDIAVVARLDLARLRRSRRGRARPGRRPCRACRRRGSRSSCGRPESGSNGRRWCAAPGPARREARRRRAGAAAIDDEPAGAVAQLEGEGRGAAAGEGAAGGGGAASTTTIVPLASSR